MELRIVAEAAEGYGADWGKELSLVELAANAGANAIKFQLLHPDELLTPGHPLYGLVEELQLPPERWHVVAERAREKKVELLLDVFGERGLRLAEELGVAAVKVHSSDMLNGSLLEEVAASAIPEVLISAGGTTIEEIDRAVATLPGKRITIVLGFQAYPTPLPENRLYRLLTLRQAFPEVALGFADHTGKDEAAATWLPALAVALGATYVEKHITVAHVLGDPDHESALAPDRFARFVQSMREGLAALGEPEYEDEMGQVEQAYRLRMKKHVVAARDLPAGTELSRDDLLLKRVHEPPVDVLFSLDDAVGEVLASPLAANAPLGRGDLR